MSESEALDEMRATLDAELPDEVSIADLAFEGPELVIYTDTPDQIAADDGLVGRLARTARKHITIRPTPAVRTAEADARPRIRELVPDAAGINNLQFYDGTGEVLIEAEKPGVVIGDHGDTLRSITAEVGWRPEVLRTPPMASNVVENIRRFLTQDRDERRAFLERVGDQIHETPSPEPEWVRVTTLGCCREVGRASFVLSTSNTRVLIDCGDKPGAEGEVPYLQAPEANPIADLDAVVLTHAHLDHSALLPLLFKYGYDGPVYMTPPTRDIAGLLQLDYLDVAAKEGRTPPYESEMVRTELKHTITVGYNEVTDIAPDIRLTFHNAGHILGSAVAHFHVGEGFHNVVFSGDVHYKDTRLFNGADNDFPRVETLFMESTYGRRGDYQTDQEDSERTLNGLVRETCEAGGKVVIPSFAVGRSQELMLVLEEAMREGKIPEVPVYLDGMIRGATAIHTAYPEYLRDGLRQRILQDDENPFMAEQFEQVDGGQELRERIAGGDPCIILSTSGMVTGGPIMSWLELLGPDPDNALLFVGYQAQGTLGQRIKAGERRVPIGGGRGRAEELTLKLDIESVSGFSGHADRNGLEHFVGTMDLQPEEVFCVHGDETATDQLSSALYENLGMRTYAPMNLETRRFD